MCIRDRNDTFRDDVEIDGELAWLLGFYIAEGTLGEYSYRNQWKVVNNNKQHLLKRQKIMTNSLGMETVVSQYESDGKLKSLQGFGNSNLLTQYFEHHCYVKGHKVIPAMVLNGTKHVKRCFLDGMMAGDGQLGRKDKTAHIRQIHKSIVSGLCVIIDKLGYDYSLKFQKDKPNFIAMRIIMDKTNYGPRPYNEVKFLEKFEIDENVYDLSTDLSLIHISEPTRPY